MSMAATLGLMRSVLVYGGPWRQPRLRRFYRQFVQPGDTVFDIGAHVGDRSWAFAALGARVIACEPQPGPRRYLIWRLGRRPEVVVLAEAVGEVAGKASLAVSERHPTLATLSREWTRRIGQDNASFEAVEWGRSVTVPVTTLDHLIAQHGLPSFCKIDVEGYEAAILQGLSQPLPALSFEFVAGGEDIALACITRLGELGEYRYNLVEGERRRLAFEPWQSPQAMAAWIRQNARTVGSGDIYAHRVTEGERA